MPQPQTIVQQQSFGTFAWIVTLLIIAVIFCIMYFWVRRKTHPKQIDTKAGDEGED